MTLEQDHPTQNLGLTQNEGETIDSENLWEEPHEQVVLNGNPKIGREMVGMEIDDKLRGFENGTLVALTSNNRQTGHLGVKGTNELGQTTFYKLAEKNVDSEGETTHEYHGKFQWKAERLKIKGQNVKTLKPLPTETTGTNEHDQIVVTTYEYDQLGRLKDKVTKVDGKDAHSIIYTYRNMSDKTLRMVSWKDNAQNLFVDKSMQPNGQIRTTHQTIGRNNVQETTDTDPKYKDADEYARAVERSL